MKRGRSGGSKGHRDSKGIHKRKESVRGEREREGRTQNMVKVKG